MKRTELESFIMETYNAEADYPWLKYPNYEVFRHCNNRKWFALIMDVPKNKLGLQGEEMLEVVNFKCDPILIGTLREEPGFFPAYHMSKDILIHAQLFSYAFFFERLFIVDLQNVRRAVSNIYDHIHACHVVKIFRDCSISLWINKAADYGEMVTNVIVLAVNVRLFQKILSCAFTLNCEHSGGTAYRKIIKTTP